MNVIGTYHVHAVVVVVVGRILVAMKALAKPLGN